MIVRRFMICLLFGVLWLYAGTVDAQYQLLPEIPQQHSYNVKDEGAVGDGKTLNTVFIQNALDKARTSGGIVVVPKGVFRCGPLTMYSKTNLVLEEGAVLKLISDIESFPVADNRYLNFINVNNANDIKISGKGTLDGQGSIWWQRFINKEITARRPQMVFISNSTKIEVEGITFLNPPNTHLSLKNTSEVYIHGITISAPEKSKNTDGINISARNCVIEKCNISTGDDNIAINFGNKQAAADGPECRNIIIRDCYFGHGHGLSIGSYTSGGLSNLAVSRCVFEGTTSAIRIKTARGRGGLVENISYTDISIKDVKWPIFISEYYPKEPAVPQDDTVTLAGERTPEYRNISLKNIKVTGAGEALKIWGLPESPIKALYFSNVTVNAMSGVQLYHVKDAVFENCRFSAQKGERVSTFKADFKGGL